MGTPAVCRFAIIDDLGRSQRVANNLRKVGKECRKITLGRVDKKNQGFTDFSFFREI